MSICIPPTPQPSSIESFGITPVCPELTPGAPLLIRRQARIEALVVLEWCVWHGHVDPPLVELARLLQQVTCDPRSTWISNTDAERDLVDCLANFSGDPESPEDLFALARAAKALIMEIPDDDC